MRKFKLALIIALLLLWAGSAQASLISTFTSGDEGWTGSGGVTLQYNSSGGNPGGFLQGTDTTTGHYWYFDAPASWFDTAGERNWSGYINGTLAFDLKILTAISERGSASPDVIILSGSNSFVWPKNNGATHILPDNSWQTFSVQLSDAYFTKSPGTSVTFANIMSNVTGLQIRGEYLGVDGDKTGLDNVRVNPTPIPGAIWLLGAGLAGLAGLRRKFPA